ncbi:MAG: tetratricopeptide repeat protein [Betaproteobacteria bacterium]|nr:tetratricopeptide repeat protein [Betaproteobacteria bacterium]
MGRIDRPGRQEEMRHGATIVVLTLSLWLWGCSGSEWIPTPGPTPPAADLEAARKQLLENIDHAIAAQARGAILVLDASPSDRHGLAVDNVSYLNQRRERLRRRKLRLILLWPTDLAQALMGGAPDLWSMRALAPVVDAADVQREGAGRALDFIEPSGDRQGAGLTPLQQAQWQRWLAHRQLSAAQLSIADAFVLIDALREQREWQAMADLSEGVLRELAHAGEASQRAERARALQWLSLARASQGDRLGSLAPALETVEIGEKLAAQNFAAYAPDLAGSLNNLSIRLAEGGDRPGGLAAVRRAVELYEKLAAQNFAAYAPDLATSLNNLSNRLAEGGERPGGMAAIRRAVEIREKLAAQNFAAYAPDLAMSINNLSNRLAEGGERAEARAVLQRAIEILRPFALPGTVHAERLPGMERRLAQWG